MSAHEEGPAERDAWPIAPVVMPPAVDCAAVPPVPPPRPAPAPGGPPPAGPPTSPPPAGPPPFVPAPPRPVTPGRWRRAGWLVLAGFVALAVVAGVGTVVWLARSPHSGQPVAAPPRSAASEQRSPSDNLVDSDDFTGTVLAPKKWDVYQSTAPNGSSWSPDQVQVRDGELQIVGTGRDPTGQGNRSGGLCWCRGTGNRTHGIWEVRARFDAGAGYGQIIGLWPKSDRPTDGWITFADAKEPDKHTVRGHVSWSGAKPASDERALPGDFTAWHTYQMEWRETFVRMSVDGTPLYDSTTSTAGVVLPRLPLHLYFQQMVGPGEGVPAPNAGTPDRVVMHIDWVRVYR